MDTNRRSTGGSDRSSRPVLHQFDWTTAESVSAAVVRAVAAVPDTSPTDLPPLYDVVDPDALDALVMDEDYSPAKGPITVTFTFEGYFVEVTSTGDGYVSLPDATPDV